MPLVSVIMTFFNETTSQLERSINSILNQSLKDIEFIIVSGNPDNIDGVSLIKKINDSRLILIELQSKTRMTNCLNLAIDKAKSEYLALQEADDESLEDRLKVQYDYIYKNKDVDIVGTSITYIDDYSKKVLATRNYPENPTKIFNRYAAIAHPTIMAKTSLYQKYGTYLETDEYRNCPDYELWFRWISQGVVFRNINQSLFKYYQTKDNGRNKNAKKTLQSVVKLKKKYFDILNFSLIDRIILLLERCLILLPQSFVSKLFYIWVRI